MGQKIDIRIINLTKWYVPKSMSIEKAEKSAETIVLGYFDALQMRGLQIDSERVHPFTAGYEKLEEWKLVEKRGEKLVEKRGEKHGEKHGLIDYSSQEQILFLKVCDEGQEDGTCFTQRTVDEFWNDRTWPYLFLSMIHISHTGNLKNALERIRSVFGENYLSYVSFDYCDIVLFSHNVRIDDFIMKIKCLFKTEDGNASVFFDTFSMVSFRPSYVKMQTCEDKMKLCEKQGFQATINLSIRDYERFDGWYSDIEKLDSGIVRYNMFGRHDISIVNDHADTIWLMQIMRELHKEDNHKIFWTFETYIKILDKSDVKMISGQSEHLDSIYNNVAQRLAREIKKLEEVISKLDIPDGNRYLLPIYEVRDCICSIVKNSFAEEFVYCIYESFLHFVKYMKNEIQSSDKAEKKSCAGKNFEVDVAECYDKYFTALNTLVNSMMHSERQFVQATAFNAVFHSIPPKLMAFYNAYIYRVKQILQDEGCTNQYTVLIYPSFSSNIYVERISLDDAPPADRILTVKINEKSLYDIESVMYQMVHELAHFVGEDLRRRKERKVKTMTTLLRYIVNECGMSDETYQLLFAFIEKEILNASTGGVDHEADQYKYLEYFRQAGEQLLCLLGDSERCMEFFKEYYQKRIDGEYRFHDDILCKMGIEEADQKVFREHLIEQYCNVQYALFADELNKMNFGNAIEKYSLYVDLIRSVYSECYADLQMILVLAMSAEDYLSTFLVKQKLQPEEILLDPESMIRISTIYRVMKECSIWTEAEAVNVSRYKSVIDLMNGYNQDVETGTSHERYAATQETIERIRFQLQEYEFRDGIRLKKASSENIVNTNIEQKDIALYGDIAIGLYEYLLEVMEKSLEEYKTDHKKAEIKKVRKTVREVLNFEDLGRVFGCIEEELKFYMTDGCRICFAEKEKQIY